MLTLTTASDSGECNHVASEREFVAARSGAFGGDGDRLEGVVIREHVDEGRGLSGELECVEYVGHSVGDDDRRVIRDLEMKVRASSGRPTRTRVTMRRKPIRTSVGGPC